MSKRAKLFLLNVFNFSHIVYKLLTICCSHEILPICCCYLSFYLCQLFITVVGGGVFDTVNCHLFIMRSEKFDVQAIQAIYQSIRENIRNTRIYNANIS